MNDEEINHAGYLLKKGPNNSWQKRWCVITKNKFVYYKHKLDIRTEEHPQGTISLFGCACLLPARDDVLTSKKENCFMLKSHNKEFYLSCDNKKELERWTSVLNNCVKAATGLPVAHCFKKVHFTRATFCAKCESFIWGIGKQGFMCKVCRLCIHKKCIFKVLDNCALSAKDGKEKRSLTKNSLQLPDSVSLEELQNTLKQIDSKEQDEIREVGSRYESQISEIFDELSHREQTEIAELEDRYEITKLELLGEIQRRKTG